MLPILPEICKNGNSSDTEDLTDDEPDFPIYFNFTSYNKLKIYKTNLKSKCNLKTTTPK